jgi:metal-responsive CopG/Arc/MetJ family transcriptional regulator
MVTQMITLKLENNFLKNIDEMVHRRGYQNRTEFIRNAIREKVDEERYKEAAASISHLLGASKKKTTEKEFEMMREEGFKSLPKTKEESEKLFRSVGL